MILRWQETSAALMWPTGEQKRILAALGFEMAEDWTITAPDLASRRGRPGGHRRGSHPRPRAGCRALHPAAARRWRRASRRRPRRRCSSAACRRAAAARGLNEAITWSFLPQAEAAHFVDGNSDLWSLANPISEDLEVMRPSLLPGLLSAAQRNRIAAPPAVPPVRDRPPLLAR